MLGGQRFVAMLDATVDEADSWLRQRHDWPRRDALDPDNDVLEVLG